jgi:hypothetical protein
MRRDTSCNSTIDTAWEGQDQEELDRVCPETSEKQEGGLQTRGNRINFSTSTNALRRKYIREYIRSSLLEPHSAKHSTSSTLGMRSGSWPMIT